jgi:hypothetical protein
MLLLMWLLTAIVTVPPAIALAGAIATHLGSSTEADAAADAVNYDWLQEFRAAAGPLGRSLGPEVIGAAATADNADAFSDATAQSAVVAIAAASYVFLLWFLSAGIIRRLAADRPLHASGFGATSGAFAGRLLRLGAIAALVYIVLFGAIHQTLFDDLFDVMTRNMTAERTAFAVQMLLYALFFALLAGINLLIDFARVRLVVEERYSVIGALVAAAHFIRVRPSLAIGVYAINVAAYATIVAVYFVVAPGAAGAGWRAWLAFAIGQIFIVARLAAKATLWAAETAAVQTRVADDLTIYRLDDLTISLGVLESDDVVRCPCEWRIAPAARAGRATTIVQSSNRQFVKFEAMIALMASESSDSIASSSSAMARTEARFFATICRAVS